MALYTCILGRSIHTMVENYFNERSKHVKIDEMYTMIRKCPFRSKRDGGEPDAVDILAIVRDKKSKLWSGTPFPSRTE
ncbi:hypothetical protein CHS0354_032008 [Potamilus streckersoni]|uniref:Uncharacterized protein n=1 Tax=Potamilus streckersoni TaxID=2493646 RepID=A0AAE0TMP1_9BIVA|nr:hypothetical protein CHS0354_032008 [Potamilus streckersoni]